MPPPTAMIAGTAHRMITGIFSSSMTSNITTSIKTRRGQRRSDIGNKWQVPPFSSCVAFCGWRQSNEEIDFGGRRRRFAVDRCDGAEHGYRLRLACHGSDRAGGSYRDQDL